ncbi:helix-turn-helix domain-containing protein [Saccharothrix coeruleofusca]|uniref:helix-turn-helix domain-containing protein n=1 Tax=Saccharothrix coeruleofusca TaxID=33919 RepID=UPI001E308AEE|nr:helix-turn-helix domain-containing protein [Saccharothrix coeruleofusca]
MHGHDAAGVVVRADGSGPPEGARVALGMAHGAWAQRVAVGPAWLGTVPEGVDLADAAALGTAGVTALRVLRKRSVLARNVLVTGVAGGVGYFAVQLAALAGARVTALVGSPQRAAGLRELGADEVLTGLDGVEGRFDFVMDAVGGPVTVQAWRALAEGGASGAPGGAGRRGRPAGAGHRARDRERFQRAAGVVRPGGGAPGHRRGRRPPRGIGTGASALGQTPGAYVTRWRIDLACARLRDTDEPVESISSAVGYGSPHAFSRAFRRAKGVAAGEYRSRPRG